MKIYFLLDRSGSMETLWKEALGSINGFIEKQTFETEVFIAAFDTVGFDVLRDTTVKDFRRVTNDDVMPRGGTPLLDASARVLQRVLEDKRERSLFVVMTDGEENSSFKYNLNEVKAMMQQAKSKGCEIIFLGANFDKIGTVAASFGLNQNKFVNMSADAMMAYTTTTLANATRSYSVGASASIDLDEAHKLAAGGH